MRRVLFIAALFAVLAACSPKTPEGARCDDIGGIGQCPEGQRCGADGSCSVAAVACPEICSTTSCNGSELSKCTPDALLVCAHVEQSTCGAHQECHADVGACECPAAGCGDFRECRAVTGGTDCECRPDGGCTQAGTRCSLDGTSTVACQQDDGCLHPLEAVPCPDPGMTCSGTLPDASCTCPGDGPGEGDGCGLTAGLASCAGTTQLTCQPKVPSSSCLVWKKVEDCSLAGLQCSAAGAGACVCPALTPSPRTIYADASAGRREGLTVTGVQTPLCRFAKLADAVAVAAAGDTVQATGANPPVTFREGTLFVPNGVVVTTSDATPTPTNFVIEPEDSVAGQTFITLRPGSTLRGFDVRNRSATGSAVVASCSGGPDTDTVSVESIRIDGQGTVTPSSHFKHGIRLDGNCSFALLDSTIEEVVESGLYLFPASAVRLTVTGNTIQRNTASEVFTINGSNRTGAGMVMRGAAPQAITFAGNRLLKNSGDQLLVFTAGNVSLARPACDALSNVVACYSGLGVGISSGVAELDVSRFVWPKDGPNLLPGQDFVTDPGRTISGTGTACPAFSGPCPDPFAP